MIYLAHPTGAIEACEHETNAQRLEAQGYVRCSYALYRTLWRRKDRRAGNALWLALSMERTTLETASLARAVGQEGNP